ncbi:6150_t:CDS:1, partial [Cetraspora pellucida]
ARVDRRYVDGHVVDVVGGWVVGGRVVGGQVVDVVGRIVDGPAEVAL